MTTRRRAPARWWKSTEDALLRREYATRDLADLARAIGCTVAAIRARAIVLRLHRPRPARPGPPGWAAPNPVTPAQAAAIADLAQRAPAWADVARLAAEIGLAPHVVRRRLRAAGCALARTAPPAWTAAQDALLAMCADESVSAIIAALAQRHGVQRTRRAVLLRMHRLGISTRRLARGGYTVAELVGALRVHTSCLSRWIAAGLPARRWRDPARRTTRHDPSGKGQPWIVKPEDLAAWLRAHPATLAYVRARADRVWLSDVLGELPEVRQHHSGHDGPTAAVVLWDEAA